MIVLFVLKQGVEKTALVKSLQNIRKFSCKLDKDSTESQNPFFV